ncbi:MAG: hypothetical protein ACYDD1_00880 [Caulobacteraceae bacterium]
MKDFGIYARHTLDPSTNWPDVPNFDLFISAFNLSERVQTVYNKVRSREKLWLVHKEYGIPGIKLPLQAMFSSDADDESSYCNELVEFLLRNNAVFSPSFLLAIDITGILRPHILFLFKLLKAAGVTKIFVFYAEPVQYASKENTAFSAGAIYEVRSVQGYEGSPKGSNPEADFLVIGMGYDDRMIAEVADDRAKAEKHQLFGLPSLRADMYQQSVIRSRRAAEELGDPDFSASSRSFAPANDPFGTADALAEVVRARRERGTISNLYLSPLGTKAQVLGFALYHLLSTHLEEASIIFPFSYGYAPETSLGLSKAWMYVVEF